MLTATAVEKARAKEKRYFLTDQNGLTLQVTAKGQKTWVLRIQSDGKDRKVTLGRYPCHVAPTGTPGGRGSTWQSRKWASVKT